MYKYQKNNRYFAQTADDIKDLAGEELNALGASDISPAYRGVYFIADRKALYAINYHARLIHRVLAPLISFSCPSTDILYRNAMQIRWEDFLDASRTFAIFATGSNSALNHSKFAALRLKDAVVDSFRKRTGQRPSIHTTNPDVWFNLHIENDMAVIALDTSGGSLHRRGYRRQSVEAPMMETSAAAILRYSEWDGRKPFHDPFCGSGTLLCEACLLASNTPAAFLRKKFGFEALPDFDAGLWKQVKREGRQHIRRLPQGLISGSDISSEAVAVAVTNCEAVDKTRAIRVQRQDVFDIDRIEEGSVIVCNPPYGIRLGKPDDLRAFYKRFGDFLKQRCQGSTAYVYFGDREYIKNLGLKPSWKKPLSVGGLDGRLVKVDLYG